MSVFWLLFDFLLFLNGGSVNVHWKVMLIAHSTFNYIDVCMYIALFCLPAQSVYQLRDMRILFKRPIPRTNVKIKRKQASEKERRHNWTKDEIYGFTIDSPFMEHSSFARRRQRRRSMLACNYTVRCFEHGAGVFVHWRRCHRLWMMIKVFLNWLEYGFNWTHKM